MPSAAPPPASHSGKSPAVPTNPSRGPTSAHVSYETRIPSPNPNSNRNLLLFLCPFILLRIFYYFSVPLYCCEIAPKLLLVLLPECQAPLHHPRHTMVNHRPLHRVFPWSQPAPTFHPVSRAFHDATLHLIINHANHSLYFVCGLICCLWTYMRAGRTLQHERAGITAPTNPSFSKPNRRRLF